MQLHGFCGSQEIHLNIYIYIYIYVVDSVKDENLVFKFFLRFVI